MTQVRADPRDEPTTWDHTLPPIWKEGFWALDWLLLRVSPVYYGIGVARGDGSPVVLVPGYLGTDLYLGELYLWLQRIGYRPYMSGIGVNVECPGSVTERLLKTVMRARAETGKPVRIIGHSLGGILGRRLCLRHPEAARQLICLGSPLQAVRAHPAVVAAATLLYTTLSMVTPGRSDCLTEGCPCGFVRDIERPLDAGIDHAAVYTEKDGVVDWHTATEVDPSLNHEVGGTHIGLVYNPRAYRVLADLLANPRR